MNDVRDILSGKDQSVTAGTLRCAARFAEPFYATTMRLRNRLFDLGIKGTTQLGRPTISIGNITTGGTGKTPMVQWLAGRLRDSGRHVAVLARGYKSSGGNLGDEQRMLMSSLNSPGKAPVELVANPDRVAGAVELLERNPKVDAILLDDAFQHRRAGRDLDIVLISAVEPFGFGHVLPRGLLREPLAGLARADAMVLTHCDLVDELTISKLERQLRQFNPDAPIYRASHAHLGVRVGEEHELRPISCLSGKALFAFAGIGAPAQLEAQLQKYSANIRGTRWLTDHTAYDRQLLAELQSAARSKGAEALLTTEKDWVKIAEVAAEPDWLPIWRLRMELRFSGDDESRLWAQISMKIPGLTTGS